MFTGIIEHKGQIKKFSFGKKEVAVEAPSLTERIDIGESLAVNGVCLSLVKKEGNTLTFHLSPETLDSTTLGSLRIGDSLNLELPLSLSSPLGGHLITGHIDATAKVLRIIQKQEGKRMAFSFPPNLRPYLIPKGSVAVNGVSLTVAALTPSSFETEIIPITLKNSNLGNLRQGDRVNLECDMIGKYVYNWVLGQKS